MTILKEMTIFATLDGANKFLGKNWKNEICLFMSVPLDEKEQTKCVCVVSALELRTVEYAEEASKLPFQLAWGQHSNWLRSFLPSESINYTGFYMGLERNFGIVCFSLTTERLFWDYGTFIQFF